MSIASEITRLQGVKSDILQAIADKGVTVPAGSVLDDCPDLIASIATGGGIGSITINGHNYGVAPVEYQGHTYLWTTSDLIEVVGTTGQGGGLDDSKKLGNCVYYHNRGNVENLINAIAPDGFHVPSESELYTLLDNLGSVCLQNPNLFNGMGTNIYGVSIVPNGYLVVTSDYFLQNASNAYIAQLGTDMSAAYYLYYNGSNITYSVHGNFGDYYYPTRLVKQIS